jgi:hypothetical protein
MAAPHFIQVLFWLGLVAVVIGGIGVLIVGLRDNHAATAISGIGLILFGPLGVRLYAEAMIVVFRINETLTDLRELAVWGADQAFVRLGTEPPPDAEFGESS